MAMIICPNCGEQVSDKAKKCVSCGWILIPDEKKICAECGAVLENDMETCPNCGCPVEEEKLVEENTQQVQVTGVKITKKIKMILIAVVVAVAAVIAISCAGVQAHKKAVAAQVAAEEKKQSEEYATTFQAAAYKMLLGAADAEDCGNLTKKVWYNAIYKEYSDETNKYTRPNGYFVSDFNEAVQNLFNDSGFQSTLNKVKDNEDQVAAFMKELNSPPEKYKEAYASLSQMYESYLTLMNLVTDPKGSLQSFTNDFTDADKAVVQKFDAVAVYFEE